MTALTIRVSDPCEIAILTAYPHRHLLPGPSCQALTAAHQELRRQAVLAARQEDLDAVDIRNQSGDLLLQWPVDG